MQLKSYIVTLLLVLLVFPVDGSAQGFSLIDETEPDSELTSPDEPKDIIPVEGVDSEPIDEPEYRLFVGDWRGIYILYIILPPIIFFVIFYLIYRNHVDRWVADRERSPASLRHLYALLGTLLTIVVYGAVFVIILSLVEKLAGFIAFGVLALILLVVVLVKLRS